MKKSLITLSALAVLFSSTAFAGTSTAPKHSEAMHKAMDSCMAAAGIEKPAMPNDKNGDRPEPPKDANGNPMPPKDGQNGTPPEPPKDANGNPMPPKDGDMKGGKGGHPHAQMTDAQRTQVESCMAKAGFEKPKDHPQHTQKSTKSTTSK